MKRQTKKNLLITAAVIVVIGLIIFGILALRSDAFGLNMFERAQVVATANGENITLGEFASAYNDQHYNISYYAQMYAMYGIDVDLGYDIYSDTWEDELKEDVLKSIILQHLYPQKAKELGLELDDETEAKCKAAGKEAVKSLEESIRTDLKNNGYTEDMLDQYVAKSAANYYMQYGTTKQGYMRKNVRNSYAAAYGELIANYYADERAVEASEYEPKYLEFVQNNYVDGYKEGNYKSSMSSYLTGSVGYPGLYIPEDFIFVRVAQFDFTTLEDANSFADTVTDAASFEEAILKEDNLCAYFKTTDKFAIEEGIAIGEKDNVFPDEIYTTAAAIEIGDLTNAVVTTEVSDENPEPKYSLYLIMRVAGETGVVPYAKYESVLSSSIETMIKNEYVTGITNAWLENENIEYRSEAYKTINALG